MSKTTETRIAEAVNPYESVGGEDDAHARFQGYIENAIEMIAEGIYDGDDMTAKEIIERAVEAGAEAL